MVTVVHGEPYIRTYNIHTYSTQTYIMVYIVYMYTYVHTNNQLFKLYLFIVGFSMVHACDIHVT